MGGETLVDLILNKHKLSSEKIIYDCINGDSEIECADEKETRIK
jgi:hypothetical protein